MKEEDRGELYRWLAEGTARPKSRIPAYYRMRHHRHLTLQVDRFDGVRELIAKRIGGEVAGHSGRIAQRPA